MVLFLNKSDIFRNDCLQNGISLRTCFDNLDEEFPEYQNPKISLVIPWMMRRESMNKLAPDDVVNLIHDYVKLLNSTELQICYEESVNFIKSEFENTKRVQIDKHGNAIAMYAHLTCAIDRNNLEKVFQEVRHITIETKLRCFT